MPLTGTRTVSLQIHLTQEEHNALCLSAYNNRRVYQDQAAHYIAQAALADKKLHELQFGSPMVQNIPPPQVPRAGIDYPGPTPHSHTSSPLPPHTFHPDPLESATEDFNSVGQASGPIYSGDPLNPEPTSPSPPKEDTRDNIRLYSITMDVKASTYDLILAKAASRGDKITEVVENILNNWADMVQHFNPYK